MKIAIFHELQNGGARRSVNEFAKRLKKNNVIDLYIVDQKDHIEENSFFNNTFLYKFSPREWSGGNWKVKLYKDTVELYHLYKLHKEIALAINNKQYDIVFVHPSQFTQAPFILRFIRTKKIYYCQEPLRIAYESLFSIPANISLPKKIYEKTIRWTKKELDKKNIAHADLICANSIYSQKNIKQAYGIKSIVSYLGVDTTTFTPSKMTKNVDVLFIGAQTDIDGYPLLEDAVTHMIKKPKVRMHITGKDWIKNDKELRRLYTGAKLVVCLSQNEPFGLIPLEAMSCGVPVIAVNDGGYKETVKDKETGYLVPRDSGYLAKKIQFLLSNEKIRLEMGKNARKHIEENWTWQKSVLTLEKIMVACISTVKD